MAVNVVDLIVRAVTGDAEKSVNKFTSNADKSLKSIESGFNALKAVAVGAVAVLAGREIIQFFGDAIKASSEQEDAINKLNFVLKSNGEFTEEVSKNFQTLASQLQNTSTVGDQVILNQIALGKSLGLTNEQTETLTRAALDLSAVTGDQLNVSFDKLQKTMGGVAGELGKQLPAVKALTKEQLAAGKALEIVREQFKGAAEAQTRTFSGAVTQSRNKFGDLLEVIGDFITQNPRVIELIRLAGKGFDELSKFLVENKDNFSDVVNIGLQGILNTIPRVLEVVKSLVLGFNTAGGTLLQFISSASQIESADFAFKPLQVAVEGLIKLLAFIPLTVLDIIEGFSKFPGASTALGALGVDAEKLQEKFAGLREGVFEFTDSAVDGPQKFSDEFKNVSEVAEGAIQGTIQQGIALEKQFDSLIDTTKDLATQVDSAGDAGKKAGDKFNEGFKETPSLIESAIEQLGELAFKAAQGIKVLLTISVPIAQAKQQIEDFAASIPLIADKFASELRDEFALFETQVQVSLEADIKKIADSIPKALEKARKEAEKAGNEQISAIEDAADAERQALQDANQLELENQLALLQAEFDQGLLTAQQLADAELALQTSLQEQLNDQLLQLQTETEQKIADQRLANDIAIEQAVAAEKRRLEEEINTLKLSAETSIAEQRLLVENKIAEKRLALEEELLKKRIDLEQKTEQASSALLGAVTSSVVDVFAPGMGKIAGEFVTLLAQGGDQLASAITDVVGGLKGVVNGIIDSIGPVLEAIIVAVIDTAPDILDTIIDKAPDIAVALINALINAVPKLIEKFAERLGGLFDEVSKFLRDPLQSIANVLAPIGDFLKGIANAIIDTLNILPFVNLPRLATGGTIPSGFEGDTFPAFLSSGEMVVPRDDVSRLNDFLDNVDGSSASSGSGVDVLSAITALDQQSEKNVTVNITIGEQELASVLLNLNRRGFRTA